MNPDAQKNYSANESSNRGVGKETQFGIAVNRFSKRNVGLFANGAKGRNKKIKDD